MRPSYRLLDRLSMRDVLIRRKDLAVGALVASSSSCVPWAISAPFFISRMWSALRICDSRWVISSVVRPSQDAAHRALDLVFGGAVDGAGRVVQDQDARVGQEGAGDGEALALPARERHAALADHGLVAFGKACDKLVRLRLRAPLPRSAPASPRPRAPKAMFSAIVRENRKISCSIVAICARRLSRLHSRTSTPSISTRPAAGSKVRLSSLVSVRLARAGLPDDRDGLAGLGGKRDIAQHALCAPGAVPFVFNAGWSVIVAADDSRS